MSNQVSVIHHQIADVQNTNPLSIKTILTSVREKYFISVRMLYKELFLFRFQYIKIPISVAESARRGIGN